MDKPNLAMRVYSKDKYSNSVNDSQSMKKFLNEEGLKISDSVPTFEERKGYPIISIDLLNEYTKLYPLS
jgi:hypothetical protein